MGKELLDEVADREPALRQRRRAECERRGGGVEDHGSALAVFGDDVVEGGGEGEGHVRERRQGFDHDELRVLGHARLPARGFGCGAGPVPGEVVVRRTCGYAKGVVPLVGLGRPGHGLEFLESSGVRRRRIGVGGLEWGF